MPRRCGSRALGRTQLIHQVTGGADVAISGVGRAAAGSDRESFLKQGLEAQTLDQLWPRHNERRN